MMPAPIDLTSRRFGRLVALDKATQGRIRSWRCQCDCGKTTVVGTNKLTSGHTQSCGCWKQETTRTNGFKNLVHGKGHGARDRTYKSWLAMRERCRDLENKSYGGRGIAICPEWNSYLNFLADMGERPDGMTLDRIDVNDGYSPENCRWADGKTQQRNRRNTTFLIAGNRREPASKIAEELGVSKSAMNYFVTVSRKMKDLYGLYLHPEDR